MVSTLVWSSRLVWRWARPSPQHRMMRARCTSRCGDVRFRITASSRFRSPARSRSGGAGATGMMEPPCSHCCHSYSIYQSSAQPRRSARIVVLFMKRGTSLSRTYLQSARRRRFAAPHGLPATRPGKPTCRGKACGSVIVRNRARSLMIRTCTQPIARVEDRKSSTAS